MKPRTLIIGASVAICGLSVAGVVRQTRQLDGLREEGQRLQQQLESLWGEQTKLSSSQSAGGPMISSPSSELLRLRNHVSQLARRERELANVSVENERLRNLIAAANTNAGKTLPPGYLRKSEARYVGYTSPEATLQTMLWAIQNRDYTNLVASFTPEIASDLQREMKQEGKTDEQFFKEAGALPGFNVLDRVATGDDMVELKVEIVPSSGAAAESMRFRRLKGEWKLDSH